jgi:hypothetical protein
MSNPIKIRFKPEETTPVAHIGAGEFRRSFVRSEQPFEVAEEEWPTLERTGLFEVAPAALPPPPVEKKEAVPAEPEKSANTDAVDESSATDTQAVKKSNKKK